MFCNIGPGPNVMKLFTSVIYECSLQARVFVPGKLLQHSLMFLGKVRRIPWSGAPERCFTRVGSQTIQERLGRDKHANVF